MRTKEAFELRNKQLAEIAQSSTKGLLYVIKMKLEAEKMNRKDENVCKNL